MVMVGNWLVVSLKVSGEAAVNRKSLLGYVSHTFALGPAADGLFPLGGTSGDKEQERIKLKTTGQILTIIFIVNYPTEFLMTNSAIDPGSAMTASELIPSNVNMIISFLSGTSPRQPRTKIWPSAITILY
jgi:hypothetical protein